MTDDLPTGAHLVTPRGWYEHHGIYVGEGRVVHYAGYCQGLHTGPMEEVSLEAFRAGRALAVRGMSQRATRRPKSSSAPAPGSASGATTSSPITTSTSASRPSWARAAASRRSAS